jgi:hypothetical protein
VGGSDGLRPGPRDHLITRALERLLQTLDSELRADVALDPAEGPDRLARHAMRELARELARDESAVGQAQRLNTVLRGIVSAEDDLAAAELVVPPRVLSGIKRRSPLGDPLPLPALPAIPFSQSDLLVNAEGQPNIGSELRAELATADSSRPANEIVVDDSPNERRSCWRHTPTAEGRRTARQLLSIRQHKATVALAPVGIGLPDS